MARFETFEAGKTFKIKDIAITPYTVDHSAFDAYMFLIEANGKRVLHTGDFRMHGAKGAKMPAVFEKYATDIDVLMIEGTMLSRQRESIITEHGLGGKAKDIRRDHKNIFVLCSATNIDSIAEFYAAALSNKKPFIVCEDDFQLEILRIVAKNSTSQFYNFNKHKIYTYGQNLHDMMEKYGFCFLGRTNYMTQKAIEKFPNSTLIYSMWKGYLDESHLAYDKYKSDFVNKVMLGGGRIEYLHTSGHATNEDIEKVCRITNAKIVLPIHCEKPDAFRQLGINGEICILQDGEEFCI